MAHIDIPAGDEVERLRLWKMAPAIEAGIDAFRNAVYSDDTVLSIRD